MKGGKFKALFSKLSNALDKLFIKMVDDPSSVDDIEETVTDIIRSSKLTQSIKGDLDKAILDHLFTGEEETLQEIESILDGVWGINKAAIEPFVNSIQKLASQYVIESKVLQKLVESRQNSRIRK